MAVSASDYLEKNIFESMPLFAEEAGSAKA